MNLLLSEDHTDEEKLLSIHPLMKLLMTGMRMILLVSSKSFICDHHNQAWIQDACEGYLPCMRGNLFK